jgi:hypothetical protein
VYILFLLFSYAQSIVTLSPVFELQFPVTLLPVFELQFPVSKYPICVGCHLNLQLVQMILQAFMHGWLASGVRGSSLSLN